MRKLARIVAVVSLGAFQLLGAVGVRAQVPDPCKPVVVPELCDSPLLPGTPDASPSPKPKKKKPRPAVETTEEQKAAKAKKDKAAKIPFVISGPNSTARVIDILAPLVRRGMPLNELLLKVAGPFPVAGPAWWTDDWHAPRSGGRVHQGLDIFAPHGTPLVAAADGFLSQKGAGGLCGIFVEITDAQGTQYFYCHMSAHAPGLAVGQPIKMGQHVGFVGNTGNARFTPSHVHFEFQPNGIPQPPKPHVDRWTMIAEQRAIEMLKQAGIQPDEIALPEESAFRVSRQFDLTGGGGEIATVGDELLLLAGLQPAASSLEVARTTLGRMAWEIDWAGQVDAQLADLVSGYEQYVLGSEMLGLSAWPFEEPTASYDPQTNGDGYD